MSQAPVHDDDPTLAAIRPRAVIGPYLGTGWIITGILWAASRAFTRVAGGPSSPPGFAAAILESLAIALAFAVTGRVMAIGGRLAAEAIAAWGERARRSDEALLALASRAVAALDRLLDALERRPAAAAPSAETESDRSRLLSVIGHAVRAGRGTEADRLLDEFEALFPGDPAAVGLRERREAVRREEVLGSLTQIDAARQVNDPDRVLELYRAVESSLESDRRDELGRELSRWFLQLIHRRLRIVPIQADVVRLATDVAATFGGTAEGASLRASLPMLRRSVGLCPRCAQPYVGGAAACPQCLAGSAPARDQPDSRPVADADELDLEPGAVPKKDRDDGWTQYNEDDRDDPAPPA